MIGRLRGAVVDKRMNEVVLDVGGVGYVVLVPARLAESALLENDLMLHTHLAVREDALTLYGFSTTDERDLFELLLGISGIGPRLALSILSTYSPAEVQTAARQENAAAFSAVSGIGKKNAERIVLELKNKAWSTSATDLPAGAPVDGELSQALAALGYSAAEAGRASQGIDVTLPLQEQIKEALRRLGRSR